MNNAENAIAPLMRRLLPLLLLAWLPAAQAAGPLEDGGRARVAEVVDGDTVVLDDGRQVRLVGLQAPKLPLGRPDFPTWPLAEEAKATLAELSLERTVTLGYGGRRVDRHGRALAHLHRADGLWIQGEMLRRGLARVYSFADNRALVAEMLELERSARAEERGIWGHPFYRIRTAEESANDLDSFQLVEGRVVDVAVVRGRGFLNFGADWRNDFTVTIAPDDRRAFEADDIDLERYEGRRVRVRGWLTSRNGPQISVSHPEQIEVLDP